LSNFIEARAASSRKEFTNYFQYSLKSANETMVWLSLLYDSGHGDKKELEYLLKELKEIANIFASSIIKLKGKK
jgi:four helix bundle protein